MLPSKSQKQRKLMGMVHAYNKGKLPNASKKIKDLSKSMNKKDVKDFAKTKEEKLPKHKKSSLIKYLVKLANFLDNKGLTSVADLTDSIIVKISQSEDDEMFFEDTKPQESLKPEKNEDLELLPDSSLPSVKLHRDKNLFVIQGVFDSGIKSLINIDEQTINFLNRYLDTTKGVNSKIQVPASYPYTFKEVQKIVGLILMFYSEIPSIKIDPKTSEKIIEQMMEMSPDESFSAGNLHHLEICRFDMTKSFEGDPIGETVATVDLDGKIQYLIPEKDINSKQSLEYLLNKEPKDYYSEFKEVIKKHPLGDSEHEKSMKDLADRWNKRFEESAKRNLDRRYPEDIYTGNKNEIPYGEGIEEFIDDDSSNPFIS